MKLRVLLGLFAVLLLVVACAPIPQSAPPTTAPTPVPVAPSPAPTSASAATTVAPQSAASDWQTYKNGEAGFSISYPGSSRQTELRRPK